jgi:hypothetical protein
MNDAILRQLDEQIARLVMGWTPWKSPCVGLLDAPDCWLTGDDRSPTFRMSGWRPSEDIALAWRVWERLEFPAKRLHCVTVKGRGTEWYALLSPSPWAANAGIADYGKGIFVTAETAPLVICQAALAAAIAAKQPLGN